MRIDVAAVSDTGPSRHHNEDYALVDSELGLFIVADGMGGHRAGNVASELAAETLHGHARRAVTGDEDPAEWLRCGFTAANEQILDSGRSDESRRGMGTTMTALFVRGERYWIGHVGDSRAWLARNNSTDQITSDHSLVAEQVRDGRITAEAAKTHPMRNVLTRCLGSQPQLDVDICAGEIRGGDVFVLGTDGLTTAIDADCISEVLAATSMAEEAAMELITRARTEDGSDNATSVVVRILRRSDAT